jgi:hypothetical protein
MKHNTLFNITCKYRYSPVLNMARKKEIMEFTNKIPNVLLIGIITFFFILTTGITSATAQLTFTERAADAGVAFPPNSGASVVDVDGDGLEDLVIYGYDGSNFSTFLYRNNGDGTFSDVKDSWPGLFPPSPLISGATSWADFDNDGDADVAIAVGDLNSGSAELRFLRNNIESGGQWAVLYPNLHAPWTTWTCCVGRL